MDFLPQTVAGWLGWVIVIVGGVVGLLSRTKKDSTDALDNLARVRKELLDEQEKRHLGEIERLRTDFKEQTEQLRTDAKQELDTVRMNLRGDILRLDARAEKCDHERLQLSNRLAELLATEAARTEEMEMMHRYYRDIITNLGGNVGSMQVETIEANNIHVRGEDAQTVRQDQQDNRQTRQDSREDRQDSRDDDRKPKLEEGE